MGTGLSAQYLSNVEPRCCPESTSFGSPLEVGREEPYTVRSPRPQLVLGFEVLDGTIKEVTCTVRPLGIVFMRPLGMKRSTHGKPVPLTVMEVVKASHAEDLGVKKGWKLRFIGKQDMFGKSYESTYEALCKSASVLENCG